MPIPDRKGLFDRKQKPQAAVPNRAVPAPFDPHYRKALWIALFLNALMFFVELGASWLSGSVSLMADSVDFFGDAASYGISPAVLAITASVRSRAALYKAATMGAFGIFGRSTTPERPDAEPITMGAVGLAALAVPVVLKRRKTGLNSARAAPR